MSPNHKNRKSSISKASVVRKLAEWLRENTGNGVVPYFKYSGRFMYGETCFAVTGNPNDIQAALMDFAFQHQRMAEIIRGLIKDQRQDDFGLDTIVYFPGVDIESDDAVSEEE